MYGKYGNTMKLQCFSYLTSLLMQCVIDILTGFRTRPELGPNLSFKVTDPLGPCRQGIRAGDWVQSQHYMCDMASQQCQPTNALQIFRGVDFDLCCVGDHPAKKDVGQSTGRGQMQMQRMSHSHKTDSVAVVYYGH